jgi:hypothetical protein
VAQARYHRRRRGHERLTAVTGMVLLALFAAEGVTILSVRRLLTLHFFFGMLVIGPVVLKACPTIYRFLRYYSGAAEYRRKGPPAPLLRLLGPVVLLTSASEVGTGVMLAVTRPGGSMWLLLAISVLAGLLLAVLTIHRAGAWTGLSGLGQ